MMVRIENILKTWNKYRNNIRLGVYSYTHSIVGTSSHKSILHDGVLKEKPVDDSEPQFKFFYK